MAALAPFLGTFLTVLAVRTDPNTITASVIPESCKGSAGLIVGCPIKSIVG